MLKRNLIARMLDGSSHMASECKGRVQGVVSTFVGRGPDIPDLENTVRFLTMAGRTWRDSGCYLCT